MSGTTSRTRSLTAEQLLDAYRLDPSRALDRGRLQWLARQEGLDPADRQMVSKMLEGAVDRPVPAVHRSPLARVAPTHRDKLTGADLQWLGRVGSTQPAKVSDVDARRVASLHAAVTDEGDRVLLASVLTPIADYHAARVAHSAAAYDLADTAERTDNMAARLDLGRRVRAEVARKLRDEIPELSAGEVESRAQQAERELRESVAAERAERRAEAERRLAANPAPPDAA